MKVSRILGLSMALAACSIGGWIGCSDDEVVNNPNGLDAGKPDTGIVTPADTGAGTDGNTTRDATTDTGATDAGVAAVDAAKLPVALKATLTAAQETPATTELGSGTATIEIDAARTSVKVTLSTTGLTSTISKAHIHIGNVGVPGGVALTLATASFTSPLVKTFTAADIPDGGVAGAASFADLVNVIIAGGAYVNVHTTTFQDGAIRGQIGAGTFSAKLAGVNEVPPTLTLATGSATALLNGTQDTLTVLMTYTPFELDAGTTMAHIHAGVAGTTGAVIFPLATTGPVANPLVKVLHAADLMPTDGGVPVATFAEAITAIQAGKTYVNIHTSTNPTGAIRAQLAP